MKSKHLVKVKAGAHSKRPCLSISGSQGALSTYSPQLQSTAVINSANLEPSTQKRLLAGLPRP